MAKKAIHTKTAHKTPRKKKAKLPLLSKIFLCLAAVFFVATIFTGYKYRHVLYFGYFHKPLGHASAQEVKPYKGADLPKFDVASSVSTNQLSAGDTLIIKVSAKTDKDITALPKIWVTAPNKKQVFKSPEDNLVQFKAGKIQDFVYNYTIPDNLAKGTYGVSCIFNSANEYTDYYVNTNFAKLQIQ